MQPCHLGFSEMHTDMLGTCAVAPSGNVGAEPVPEQNSSKKKRKKVRLKRKRKEDSKSKQDAFTAGMCQMPQPAGCCKLSVQQRQLVSHGYKWPWIVIQVKFLSDVVKVEF